RLQGVSRGFNDQALARGVVAHGAPYVTATKAGRSQGCPAMEPARAQRLLPKLADGGLVFLFAPDATWLQHDPWVSATAN
ncbi:MAG TPA: murein L,D-transpeptidase catalytic domain family protein, partial [Gemmatimonadaceae bacterium]